MRTLFLVRHGDEQNPEMLHGTLVDAPLTVKGLYHASRAAAKLFDEGVGFIKSSPARRAKDTADIIAMPLRLEVQVVPGLASWNTGQFSGWTLEQAIPELEKYVQQPDTPIPGGESYRDFFNRFSQELLGDIQELGGPGLGPNLVDVTHSHDFGAARTILSGGKYKPTVDGGEGWADIWRIDIEGGKWKLREMS